MHEGLDKWPLSSHPQIWPSLGLQGDTYPWCYDDSLESIKHGFHGHRGIHTAESQDGIGDGGGTVIEGLNYQRETYNKEEIEYQQISKS